MSNNQSLYWCFTLNNPEDETAPLALDYQYLIYQGEVGESGTPHLQGYVVLKNRTRITALKKVLPTAHWEARRGTHQQAKDYCRKQDGSIWYDSREYGDDSAVPNKSGQRTDLDELKKDLDLKKTFEVISDEHFGSWLRYERGIRSYANLKATHRKFEQGEKPVVKIFWGPSGSGKSTRAKLDYPGAYWLTKPTTNHGEIWWQDYSGQEVVVIDEFYSWLPYDQILRLLDYYEVTVPTKGGSVKLGAKTWIFTSNQNPINWYSKVTDKSALDRRIQEFGEVIHMDIVRSEL